MRDPPITAVGDYDTIEEIVIIGLRLGLMEACVQHSHLKSWGEEPHPLKPCRCPTTGSSSMPAEHTLCPASYPEPSQWHTSERGGFLSRAVDLESFGRAAQNGVPAIQ
jgi:hypothetical protein